MAATFAGSLAVIAFAIVAFSAFPTSVREGRGSVLPLLTGVAVFGALLVSAILMARARRRLQPGPLGDEADAAAGLGSGDLRAALELQPGDGRGSADLARLHVERVAGRLAGITADQILPHTSRLWARRLHLAVSAAGLAALALLFSALVRPKPTLSAALALSAPWKTAFPKALPPLELRVAAQVSRGDAARVRVSAPGRVEVVLFWWPAGEPAGHRQVAIEATGDATVPTAPIMSPTRVWVEDAGGVSSDTALIRPLEPLLVQDLQIRVEYPTYLGRVSDTYRGQIPPLVAPEGTRLVVSGETNLALDAGSLRWSATDDPPPDAEGRVPLDLDGIRFGVSFTPKRSGSWLWSLRSADAVGDPILPEPLQILVVPDEAPSIQLLYPPPDTTLGSDRVMPVVVDVEDDIGLRSVTIRSWQSGLGEQRSERRQTLAPSPDGARRAIFRHLIDWSDAILVPGDTLFYQFEASDGQPTRGPTLSDVFLLRVPTFTEMVEERASETRALSDSADQLEEAVGDLAEAAAEAARRVPSTDDTGESGFETSEEAREVLDDAGQASEELSALDEQIHALQDQLAQSPLADADLTRQLEMLAQRYQALKEAGLDEEIERLAEALQDLDSDAVRRALEQLSENSDWLREQLEQTLGLLEQAALDQEIESAQANTEDLAHAQRELAESEGEDATTWADEQQRLADEAAELSGALDALEARLNDNGQQAAADSAGTAHDRTDQATRSMEEAAQAGSGGEAGGEAGGEGPSERSRAAASDAAETMEQAAQALGAAQQDMQREGQEAAGQSLGRARADALSLAEEEGRLADGTRGERAQDPETWRARQAAVRQGLGNMLDRLAESGNEAAMLDQQTGAVAGDAAERMDQLLQRLAEDGARRLPSRAEAEGIQGALNALAMQLLASESAAQATQEQAQGQDAGEQMSSLAQQQQAITQETSSLLVPGPKPSGQERTRQVADRQQEVAEQLRDLQDREGELLGRPEELAKEAEELARRMEESGPTQETLQRQRRLFRRMLDAGRSLENDDLDPNRRESTTGVAQQRVAPQIDPELLRGRRFPLPPEALLRDLPVFYRPLIFEYFDRLNRPMKPGDRSGEGGR